jgi:hypothetical protein
MDLALRRITNMAFGYWQSHVLFTLADGGIFDALQAAPKSAPSLATELCLDVDVLGRTLNAGVALGLLELTDGSYANTSAASRFLVSDADESLSHWVKVMGGWVQPWSELSRYVRDGLPQSKVDESGGASQREFILGMHEFARRTAASVAKALDLGDPRTMVDVGGGAGTYSIEFARAYPRLRVDVLDLPSVLPITEGVIDDASLGARVSASPIDYLADPFGKDVDVVMFSNVLHQESEATVVDMLRRAREALSSTGSVVVHGHFLDDQRTGPTFSTLHNLSAVVLWGSGRSYTVREMESLIKESGFSRSARLVDVAGSTTQLLVVAK